MHNIQNNENNYQYRSLIGFKAIGANRQRNNANAPDSAVQIPDLYYFDPNLTKKHKEEKRKLHPLLEMPLEMFGITPWIENPLLMAPITVATLYGVGKFSDTFNGEYEKSCVGKAAKFGDKIGSSKFMQSNAIQTLKKKVHSGGVAVKKFLCKNDALRAMFETPAMPEWSTAKHEMLPRNQRLLENFNRITETLGIRDKEQQRKQNNFSAKVAGENVAENLSLDTLGLNKEEKAFIKKQFKTLNPEKIAAAEQTKAINTIILKRLKTELPDLTDEVIEKIVSSNDATQQVQNKMCEALHLTKEEIIEISKDTSGKYANKVMESLGKMKNRDSIRIGGGIYRKFLPEGFQPLERQITMSGVYNNLYSVTDGAKTTTGKVAAWMTQTAHKCVTFFGGKLCVLIMVAPVIYRAIRNTFRAEKDQKVGTLTNDIITGVSWVLTFPLAMQLMHSLGGMQYAGMTKDEVNAYKQGLKDLQDMNEKNMFKTKFEYQKAADKVMNIKKNAKGIKNQSLFTRICKNLASFLEIGNESPKAWNNPKSWGIIKWFREKNFHRKDIIGAPMRFILFLVVFQGLIDKLIEKGAGKIFGKHYDEFAAEEKIEKKKEQEKYTKQDLQNRMYQIQAEKQRMSAEGIKSIDNSAVKEQFVVPKQETEQLNTTEQSSEMPIMPTETMAQEQNPETQQIMTENKSQPQSEQNLATGQIIPQEEVQQAQVAEEALPVQPTVTFDETTQMPSETQNNNMTTEQNVTQINEPIVEQREKTNRDVVVATAPDYDINKAKTNEQQVTKTYSYIPSSENVIKKEVQKNEQSKYIPSQEGAKITKSFDNSGLDAALARADRAEQRALDILAGNFDDL